MNVDDPAVRDVLRRSMVARIATLSRTGRPSITPLYFVAPGGRIWLGTVEWTRASRNVMVDHRVSILFQVEQDPVGARVLHIRGRASVQTDQRVQRSYNLRAARKYLLTPGAIRHHLAHLRQFPLRLHYAAQSASMGQSCVIEVTPFEVEWLEL